MKKSIQLAQEVIDFSRGLTLDLVEQECGHLKSWPNLRNKLLKIFGDRGLEGKIVAILNQEVIKNEL